MPETLSTEDVRRDYTMPYLVRLPTADDVEQRLCRPHWGRG